MFQKSGKHYLYRHIRPDKNEVFYIGIGTKKNKWKYCRAMTKDYRNNLWHKIVNKNNGIFKVEILFESDNYEWIKEKEKEFVKIYGKKLNNTGSLVNFTDGGDGTVNFKHKIETIEKLRENGKGKETIDIFTGEVYKRAFDICRKFKIPKTTLLTALNKKSKHFRFMWYKDFEKTFLNIN